MYIAKLEAIRKICEQTGMGELQAYRQLQMREMIERRSGEDRRQMIRDLCKSERRSEF